MKKLVPFCFLFAVFLFANQINGQTPTPSPTPQKGNVKPADEDDVVRITTNLIQVDAVVTDKNGKPVADLKPEEFEIFENNKAQKITNFSYVVNESAPPTNATDNSNKQADKNIPVPVRLRPDQVKRTIALVIDDLSLSFQSAYYTRQALKKFVDEMMQPGDLVAIIRTGSGAGALQQFTSDKQQLYKAIELVKYNGMVGRTTAFAPVNAETEPLSDAQQANADAEAEQNQLREDVFAVGTLGALGYIIRGMRDLPGRKAVLLWSEGFTLITRRNEGIERNDRVFAAIERLTDQANRAGVVIYAADPRGLAVASVTAEDGGSAERLMSVAGERQQKLYDTQDGMIYLAEQTGGFAVRNTNDLQGGIRKVLDDQKSYYLIGYQPDASTFDPSRNRFNKLTVRIKRAGLKVRYRSGFFGIKDEDVKPVAKRTPQQQVGDALFSPFNGSDINLRLSSLFVNNTVKGSYIRTLVHISAKDLTLTKGADNMYKTVFNVVAITFGDNGAIVDQIGQTYTLEIPEEHYERVLTNGMVYTINFPVKKAGAYQMRVALRDAGTEKIGTASQFIDVPDLKNNRLAMSGIVLNGYDLKAQNNDVKRTEDGLNVEEGVIPEASPLTQAAMRRFRSGNVLQYGFFIYNANLDNTTKLPQLITQIKLFRDGQMIYQGKENALSVNGQTDLTHIEAAGAIQLGAAMLPGEYVLQVIVTDTLEKKKHQTTARWIDFEIIK